MQIESGKAVSLKTVSYNRNINRLLLYHNYKMYGYLSSTYSTHTCASHGM
jgi:hypothetical protein